MRTWVNDLNRAGGVGEWGEGILFRGGEKSPLTITLFGVKSCTFLYNFYRNMSELKDKSFVCIEVEV